VPRGTDTIYLFIVMLHATTRNLNRFTNNQILHILKLHLLWELSLKASPREATDMLNLFKTMIIPMILLAPITLTIVSVTTLIEIAVQD
jgi:hypothetical protein